MEQVTIRNVTYDVIERRTPDVVRAANHPNTARHMEKAGITETLVLQRPKGERIYIAHHFQTGAYGRVIKMA